MFEGLTIGQEIGRGAAGAVYEAATATGQRVAVKRMHPDVAADPQAASRFIREWQVIGKLRHPNVVVMRDLKATPDDLVMLMEYVPGGTLSEAFRNREFSVAATLRICADIGRGLNAIHDANIVHRDLKPSNILVAGEGEDLVPKIADFGLSRMLGNTVSRLTTNNAGTPLYISPEAVAGTERVAQPADIYALGVTIFHLVVGEPPFDGELMTLLRSHADRPPPQLLGVPSQLTELVGQMMAKSPEARPTAEAVVARLDAIIPLVDPAQKPYAGDPLPIDDAIGLFPDQNVAAAAAGTAPTPAGAELGPNLPTVDVPTNDLASSQTMVDPGPGPSPHPTPHQAPHPTPGQPPGPSSHPGPHPTAGQPPGPETTAPPAAPSERRSPSGLLLVLGGFVLAVLVAAGVTAALIRGGGDGADGVQAVADTEIGYSFNPEFYEGGLVATRNWSLNRDSGVLDGRLTLLNISSDPLEDVSYVEVLAEGVTEDVADVAFVPVPEAIQVSEGAVRFGIDRLGPDQSVDITYTVAGVGNLSVDQLAELAEETERRRADYLAELDAPVLPAPLDLAVAAIRLSPSVLQFEEGEVARQLVLVGELSDGSDAGADLLAAAAWSSGNESVAQVSASGLVRPVSPGDTTVTVVLGSLEASVSVAVGSVDVVAAPVANQTDSGNAESTPAPQATPEPSETPEPSTTPAPAATPETPATPAPSTPEPPTTVTDPDPPDTDPPTTLPGPPTVSGYRTVSITEDSARVVFTTSRCTTARFAGSGLVWEAPNWPNANAQCWTDHGHTFEGLTPDTPYTVAVEIRDTAGQSFNIGTVSFRTEPLDDVEPWPPGVRGLGATDISDTASRVVFTTSSCTTARYVLTPLDPGGRSATWEAQEWPDANARCWTDHGHTFEGLVPGVRYRVSIELRNRAGQAHTIGPVLVQTSVPSLSISGARAVAVTDGSARVVFTTSNCAAARYAGSGLLWESQGWPDPNNQCWTDHGHTFERLAPTTTYTLSLEVRDTFGQVTRSSVSFTTDPAP